jgi:hypothetical protein
LRLNHDEARARQGQNAIDMSDTQLTAIARLEERLDSLKERL